MLKVICSSWFEVLRWGICKNGKYALVTVLVADPYSLLMNQSAVPELHLLDLIDLINGGRVSFPATFSFLHSVRRLKP